MSRSKRSKLSERVIISSWARRNAELVPKGNGYGYYKLRLGELSKSRAVGLVLKKAGCTRSLCVKLKEPKVKKNSS